VVAARQGLRAPLTDLLGRLDALAARHAGQRDCAWTEIPLAAQLAHADAAFMTAPPAVAIDAIDAAAARAQQNGRLLWATRLGLMRAIVLLRAGEREAACDAARDPLRAAVAHGMTRVLTDIGTGADALARTLLQTPVDAGERAWLEATLAGVDPPRQPAVPALGAGEPGAGAELLTAREQDILDLLGKALSVKGIARTLALSPGTVKWHTKNIYGKLGAASREDALAKARARGLVR
jgi:LuxR family transcriptional regulator, maltose regulon positive regulatory protein